ncbi:MAG: hypothetical protein IKO42_02495 [Opitutales bacterium]|nr:hypothetical protein [Opitutales bacterium]
MRKTFLNFLLAAISVFGLCACNYTLDGTAQPLPFKTIAVKQVVNNSYAPQASNPLMVQVCTMLSQTPALTLVDLDDAQAVLEITLDDYTKTIYATDWRDTDMAKALTIKLSATCTLRNLKTGEVIFKDRPFSVKNHIYNNDGFLNAEYQNMTSLTGMLARKIVDGVLGVW